MKDIAVKIEDVSKYYKLYQSPKDRLKEALHPFGKKYHKKFYALKHINLEVKKGEILGIVGRNGSGKSTLLKLISGVIQPSSGQVRTKGEISALLELGSGLNPEFTGIQNIYFYGTMLGFSRQDMDKKLDEIVAFADIGEFINQPLKTYSSGMHARLGFALAIHINPEILIVDEVLGVGDELFKRKCFAKMEEFFKSGCTVFFVSHAMGAVVELCKKAILIDKGEKILEGSPKLISMYYQKLIYATPENQAQVREEILQLDKDENQKKLVLQTEENREQKEKTEKTEKNEPGSKTVDIITKEEEKKQKAYFIPNFKPKSTIEYRNYDVDIDDILIRTMDGQQVNALVIGERYVYSYRVKFNIDAENVVFGMKFKTTRGLEIEGTAEPALPGQGKYLEKVNQGDEYKLEWEFDCLLIPGNYFTNSGVYGIVNGFEGMLNRIVDSAAFIVQNVPERKYTGLVNISRNARIIKI